MHADYIAEKKWAQNELRLKIIVIQSNTHQFNFNRVLIFMTITNSE